MGTSLALAALGAAALAYGAAMGVLYPANGFFLVWVASGALLCWVAWAMRSGAWARLPVIGRRAGAAAAFALVAVTGVGCAYIWRDAEAAAPADLDYLVVLGASLNADGTPKETLAYRLDAAASYLAENPGTRCVLSGGQGPDEPQTEASAMAAYLRGRGVAGGRVILEERSTTTAENLRISREEIERDVAARDAAGANGAAGATSAAEPAADLGGSASSKEPVADSAADAPDAAQTSTVGVVTNDFHVFRALRLARGQGFARVWGVAAPTNPVYLPQALVRECFAVAKDALVGNLAL